MSELTAQLPLDGVAGSGPLAFVFQGGGSLTAVQVGMLRAVVEQGIVPDLVIGSSAGALNAVAYAAEPDLRGVRRLESSWLRMHRRDVARLSPSRMWQALLGHGDGLLASGGLRTVVERSVSTPRLSGTAIPAYVVATDVPSGDAVILHEEETVPALLASAALPGLYPPVQLAGHVLVDGGVSADIPLLQAEQLGATTSLVFPAAIEAGSANAPRGALPTAYWALGKLFAAIARSESAAARGRVLTLPVVNSRATSSLDFRDTARLITAGYDAAVAWSAGVADLSVG